MMQIGIDSFAAAISDPATGLTLSPVERMQYLLEEIELADQVGLEVFGIGEHHRAEFLDSAPAVILAAAATRTKNIRLTSAVTVLSAADPVRVFQGFVPAIRPAARRLRFTIRRKAGTTFGDSRQHQCALVRQTSPGPDRPGNLPSSTAKSIADLGRSRRHAGIVCARRDAWSAADGRDHWRRTAPLPTADRLVPRSGPARRSPGREIESRVALDRISGGHHAEGRGRFLPGLRPYLHRNRERTRLVADHARAI